jgi:predicted nucleotidyltransferase
MDKDEVIRIAREYFRYLQTKKFKISDVWLFGSYAKGTNRLESDIDLALIFNELQDEIELQIDLMKLRRKFDLRIEPHPFSLKDLEEKNPMLIEIMKTGISIK